MASASASWGGVRELGGVTGGTRVGRGDDKN